MTSQSMPIVAPVTAEKISSAGGPRRIYSGILVMRPVVGEPMIIFQDPDGRRMRTSEVKRVLSDADNPQTLYVETLNSTYRLCFQACTPPSF